MQHASSSHPIVDFFKRELRGKLRIYITWVAGPFLIYFIHSRPQPLGILCIAAGAGLRAWASGAIEKESRLSQGGPFRFSRNPLYMGSLLITLGVFLSQGWALFGGLAIAFSLLVYHPLILSEEKVLALKFPGEFESYCARVGRYVVSPSQWISQMASTSSSGTSEGDRVRMGGFHSDLFKKNRGWEPLIVGSGLILGIALIFELKRRFGLL